MSAQDAEEAYKAFCIRAHGLGMKPMTREEYEKFIYTKVPDPVPDKRPEKRIKRD